MALTEQERADAEAAYLAAWHVRQERWRWSTGDPCYHCKEWIGHSAGCPCIPVGVPLREVRPGCVMVRYPMIGRAIRAVCMENERKRRLKEREAAERAARVEGLA